MRLLVAPQEFKGSLSAAEAAQAIGHGAQRALPAAEVMLLPLSDGGPGFVDALHSALGGDLLRCTVQDPLGRPVEAEFLVSGETAFIEAAQANGLYRLGPGRLAPLEASTYGVGELLLAALAHAPSQVVVGVGGSATTDAGCGMAAALGARLLARDGAPLSSGGGALANLARIEWRRPPEWDDVDVVVATDVTNPLVGPRGAARVFAPQKGATEAQVELLERGLDQFARVAARDLDADLADLPGTGAAGGLAAGLVGFLGARIESGFDVVARATGLAREVARADLVVTGEGSFDSQSVHGKVTGRIIEAAEDEKIPWIVLCGRSERPQDRVYAIVDDPPPGRDPEADAAMLLEELAARVLARPGPRTRR